MKVIVDLRKDIHQKIIFIDDEVLWFGSLNVLSYTGETDETILRIYGPTICNSMAKHQLYKYSLNNSDKKVSPVFLLAERENNSCNECQNITEVLFRQKDRVPFLRCISCGNMQDMKEKYSSKTKTSTKKNSQLMDEAIEEVKVQRICPEHKVNLKLRNGRKGKFYGCPKYPNCKHTENY
jgi:ssDNA-binding Zn-finger/Zn-ribbon topoisomerase 1